VKIYLEDGGLLIRAETPKDGVEIGAIGANRDYFSDTFRCMFTQKGVDLRINPEHAERLQNQLEIVDELLAWEGTGNGRVDRIKELLATEQDAILELDVPAVLEDIDNKVDKPK